MPVLTKFTRPRGDRRTRILFCVANLELGGAERGLVTLLGWLDLTRFEPIVMCVSGAGPLSTALDRADIPWFTLARAHRYDAAMWLRARHAIVQLAPDIVHMVQFTAALWVAAPARSAGIDAVVYAIHGMPDRDRWYVRLLERLCIRPFATHVLSVSQRAATQLWARYPELRGRTTVIHNGVDLARFDAPTGHVYRPPGRRVLVAVARLDPIKGLDVLVTAFREIASARPDVDLWIVGDGPARAALEGQIAELRLSSRVSLLGARSDVADLLRSADVFVSSSLSECLPNAVLEAMAAGCPVVATAVGGVPEIVDARTGILVPPGSSADLAAAVLRFLDMPEMAARVAAAARRRVEDSFSLARKVADHEVFYSTRACECPARPHQSASFSSSRN
jgi:glycosyltransferase involved in cell wall biosynthesis